MTKKKHFIFCDNTCSNLVLCYTSAYVIYEWYLAIQAFVLIAFFLFASCNLVLLVLWVNVFRYIGFFFLNLFWLRITFFRLVIVLFKIKVIFQGVLTTVRVQLSKLLRQILTTSFSNIFSLLFELLQLFNFYKILMQNSST